MAPLPAFDPKVALLFGYISRDLNLYLYLYLYPNLYPTFLDGPGLVSGTDPNKDLTFWSKGPKSRGCQKPWFVGSPYVYAVCWAPTSSR